MFINVLNTVQQYEELMHIETVEQRQHYFRYTMMKSLKPMWDYLQVPIKAKQENGYDVVFAANMLGFASVDDPDILEEGLKRLKKMNAHVRGEKALKHIVNVAADQKLEVNAKAIELGIYIADAEKLSHHGAYTGFGGIPGYIMVHLFPNERNTRRFEGLLAHEFHHNIRFSYFDWSHGDVTVGEYLVIEGLADVFAEELYGSDQLGPWAIGLEEEDLAYSISVMKDALHVKGFAEVSSYMFGDQYAREKGYQPVGLSFAAGYAVGYVVVKAFLKQTGMTIFEATKRSSDEILAGSKIF
ncbi:DUF2268 domain-containing putative Zn-dependent protease [Alkalihalobacillus sp. LMS6]|uniref:DUF2268 domain-containing protein n=1 Tax=Bacillaceae TaxID=186817 RepID=UPI000C06977A|nr:MULTISPECIES: DUF2268 domain-containing putative Zn-dependent protease [Bacillaceae]UTR05895.1 DUF2268 domain-containing putative Zn-dependent protease [Alkalihalobacillus sp. LMS6]